MTVELTYDNAIRKLAGWVYQLLPDRIHVRPELQIMPEDLTLPGDGQKFSKFYPYLFVEKSFLDHSLLFTDGIPVRHRSDLRDYINPLYPAYYGLVCTKNDPDDSDVRMAQSMADFLLSQAIRQEEGLFLRYSIDHPDFGLKAPWTSCIAQAVASLLSLRLFEITSGQEYLDHAVNYARAMFVQPSNGGVLRIQDNGLPWLEEYPGSPPSSVLNGFLFAVIAICSLQRRANIQFPIKSETLLQSVYENYPAYRCGRFLRYSMKNYALCNAHYMGLHVLLFYQLHHVTGQPEMLMLARELSHSVQWSRYLTSVGNVLNAETSQWLDERFA